MWDCPAYSQVTYGVGAQPGAYAECFVLAYLLNGGQAFGLSGNASYNSSFGTGVAYTSPNQFVTGSISTNYNNSVTMVGVTPLKTGEFLKIGVVANGATKLGWLYLNGNLENTISGYSSFFPKETVQPVAGTSSTLASGVLLQIDWARMLASNERAALNENPWQLFHRRQRFYSIATSTGAVFTASPTMPDAIVAGQAALRIAASAAPTVPAGIAQASAALAITGSVAIAVPDGIVTAALSSGAVLTAALTAQHGIPQSSASLSIVATASPTVPPVSPTASGALSIALTGSATVPAGMARANAGTGSVFSVAIVAQTGAISATGALSIAATGTITAATPSVSARGALSIAGAVETAIPDAEARAAASTASGSVLSAALRVPTASPVIQAQLVVSANIAITVPDALVTAAGIIGSTPNPCMMVYLPTRDFTITIPARAFTATLPTRNSRSR